MDAYIIDKSQQVVEMLQRAQLQNAKGEFKECLDALMHLFEQKKIVIQQAEMAQSPYIGGGGLGA